MPPKAAPAPKAKAAPAPKARAKAHPMPVPRRRAILRGLMPPPPKPDWLTRFERHLRNGTCDTYGSGMINNDTARATAQFLMNQTVSYQEQILHRMILWRYRSALKVVRYMGPLLGRVHNTIRRTIARNGTLIQSMQGIAIS